MNDWNNGDYPNPVKMYYGLVSNEEFSAIPVYPCNGHIVTLTCPFSNKALDKKYRGDPIVEVAYSGGLCLGTARTGDGTLQPCGYDKYGDGGGPGTIIVDDRHYHLIDRYWTTKTGTLRKVCSSGYVGGAVFTSYLEARAYGGCDWTGPGLCVMLSKNRRWRR
jgi:hypothetical protein